MDDNSDSEYEIEEALVLVELNGIIDSDFLLQAQDQSKFLGIDTDEPILQIGNCLFKGEYEDTVGTVIVYEPKDTTKTDASETVESSYEFLCKTDKKLTMKRCFPREKYAEKLKLSEPSLLTSVQNGNSEKSQIVVSEAKGTKKIQVKSGKKEIKFPKPKQRRKLIKTNKNVGKKSFESQRKDKTKKSEASDKSKSLNKKTGNIKLGEINLNPPKVSQSANLIEKQSVNNSENTDKISRKRNYVEANANTNESDQNIDDSSTSKKKYIGQTDTFLRKGKDEKCTKEISKKNLEVNNVVNKNSNQNREDSAVIEMKDNGSENVEEYVTKELDNESTCLSFEEKNKAKVIRNANEESSFNKVSNNSLRDENKFSNYDVTNNLVESSVDKTSVLSSNNNIKDDDCSSSDDKGHARSEIISQPHDTCKPSDGKVSLLLKTGNVEKMDDNSSSSSYQENKRRIVIEPNVMMETEIIESDSVDSLNKAAKHSNCEVSQSEKINANKKLKHNEEKENSNECEDFDSSVDPIFESIKSSTDLGSSSASNKINLPAAEESAVSNPRKLSSCEVTQSEDSEKAHTNDKFAVDESEVFFPITLPNENFMNNDANEIETQFKNNRINSSIAEHSESSFKSESSTSEISQSHKSVIKESRDEMSDTRIETESEVCSQSTDQLRILSNTVSDEPKDLCVSSCNVDGEAQYANSIIEEEIQYSAETEYPLWVENETDIICEVSQSDKSENSISVNSEMSGNEIQVLSNECDESVSNLSENLNYSVVEQQDSDESNRIHEDVNVPSTSINIQTMCEVTQSTSKGCNIVTNLPVDPDNSNECEMYKANHSLAPTSNDKPKDNCVSSDDVSYFSGPLLETKVENQDKDLNCEVSQSFKSLEADESCASSDIRTKESADIVEVSQSLELESASSCNFESDVGDLGREEINYDFVKPFSKHSDDYSEEICVSSDDIASAASDVEFNSQMEEEQSVNQSTCEVSQSFRSEERIIIIPTGQSADIEIESSNECEMYATSMETAQVDKKEKNICESSDDVNESPRDVQNSFIQSGDIFDEACHSSKFDENVISSETRSRIYRKNSSECESSDERNENFNENGTICESSEYMLSGSIYAEPNFDACSSSEKSPEKHSCDSPDHQDKCYESSLNQNPSNLANVVTVDETENNQISQSFNAAADSDDLSLNEIENNQISQSGNILGCSSNITIEMENNQISQSGNSAGCSSDVILNETENNQISQSGNTASPTSNTVSKELENDQISQSNNNTDCSIEISVNEMENNQISQSSTAVDRSSNISIVEMENNQISQSGSVPSRSSDVSVIIERENNQISQSINAAGCSDDITVDEIYNNQISQSSSTPNSSSNIVLIEVENNHISQSSSNAGSSSEVSLIEIENGQISQSESDDKVYYSNNERNGLSSDSSFETNTVNVSSSGDVISSNYVNVIYSSYHTSNSTISSNSEVSPSSISEQPYVCEGDSLLTNPTTSTAGNLSEISSEIEACPTNTISDEPSVHSSISVIASTDSFVIAGTRSTEHTLSPSSNNDNEVVESSLSLVSEESKIKNSISRISKRDSTNRLIVDKKTSEVIPCTSQTLKRTDERKKKIMKPNTSKSNFSNSNQRNHSGDSNMSSMLPRIASQSEIKSYSSSSRPSLLEVIVSSASDFRNSLLSDNSYGKEKNNVSSVSESSARNVGSCNEFSESFMGEADGTASENQSSDIPLNLPFPSGDSEQVDSEISGSIDNRKYSDSNEPGYNYHRVSQSSDIVNTHSSTSKIESVILDNISQSSQQDLVQSSSNALRTSVLVPNDSVSDQVSSAVENDIFVQKSSNNADVSESSTGTDMALPSCSESHSFSVQIIQSSDDKFVFSEDISDFKPENVESVVSSTPSDLQFSNFNVLSYDGNEQCSTVEGNVIIVHQSDDNVTTVEVVSPDSDCLTYMPDLNSGTEVAEASNEAETLNHSSVSSPVTIQLVPLDQIAVSGGDESEMNIQASASNLSVNEIEVMTKAYDCEGSSEVSESLETEQNDMSQSSFPDNSVSCSVNEFSANQRGIIKKFSFLNNEFGNAPREAESKTSDDCISSYENVCDMFPGQNLPSSASKDLSMYSHIGEFDDSIQSSSLDETHLCINEQIKAISSPPNSSDSGSYMSQTPLSIGPFVTFSSQTNVLQSDQCGDSSFSKITSSLTAEELNSAVHTHDSNLYSNDISEIGESNGVIIMSLPNENSQIITAAGDDVVVESLNPEQIENIYETAQNPVISGNLDAEQYVEIHEHIPVVPNTENENSNIVVSSNDQLEENSVVPNVMFPTDPHS